MNFNFHQKAIILNSDGKFLALKATYKGLLWDIPGGKVELPEETEIALRREIKEETNFEVSNIKPLLVNSAYNKEEDFYVMVIIYLCTAIGDKPILSSEHSEYRWITKQEFLSLDAISYLKEYIGKIDIPI
jgi:8-oxo-dGTP pyrophosphatase MutT (NUDIX family)